MISSFSDAGCLMPRLPQPIRSLLLSCCSNMQAYNFRHLHEFGQGSCSHLSHDLAPIHLHRIFAQTEVTRHLLVIRPFVTSSIVSRSRRLSVPRCARNSAVVFSVLRRARLRSMAVATASSISLIPEWLGQKVDCSCLHGSYRHGHVAVPGHEDDRRVDVCLNERGLEVEPARWVHEIKHDGFRMMVRRDAAGVRLLTARDE